MAQEQQREDPADQEMRALVIQVAATRMVGELLGASHAGELRSAGAETDPEFAEHLVDYELALMAAGEDPVRIALRIAVLEIARDSLRTYAEIRALPETGPRSRPDARP